MAIKFNHQKEILVLRDEFPKYFWKYTSTKIEWGKGFAENDFRDAYISGTEKDEKLVLSTEILIGTKRLPVTFIEDIAGALSIEINRKVIYTVKSKGGISQGLLEAFTHSIIEGIR